MTKVFNIKDKTGLSAASGTNLNDLLETFCEAIDIYVRDQFSTGNIEYFLVGEITYKVDREYVKKLLEDMVSEIEESKYSYKIGSIHITDDITCYFTLEIL